MKKVLFLLTLLVGLVGFSARAQEHNLTIINEGGGRLALYDGVTESWLGQYYDSTVVTMTEQSYLVQAITFTPSYEWLEEAGVTENSMQVTHFYFDNVEKIVLFFHFLFFIINNLC